MTRSSKRSKTSSSSRRRPTRRERTVTTLGLLLLLLVVGAARLLEGTGGPSDPADTEAPTATRASSGVEDGPIDVGVPTLLDGLNAMRADAGVDAVRLDDRLGAAALAHGEDLAESGACSHDGSDGSGVETRLGRAEYAPVAYGEVVACGSQSPAEALEQWRRSGAHRAILLDARFQDAGVGVAPDGADGPIWVVTFGAER